LEGIDFHAKLFFARTNGRNLDLKNGPLPSVAADALTHKHENIYLPTRALKIKNQRACSVNA
jgi:hypothetical protein